MIINGMSWKILLVSPTHPMLLTLHNTYALGVCDKPTRIIYIANNLQRDKLKQVLCHELTHAHLYAYDEELTYDEEELVADMIMKYGSKIIRKTNKTFWKM